MTSEDNLVSFGVFDWVLEHEANLVFQLLVLLVEELDLGLSSLDVVVCEVHLRQGLVGGEKIRLVLLELGTLLLLGLLPFIGLGIQ